MKVARIAETYGEFRHIRPDGNCFFHAVGFRLFEALLGDAAVWAKVKERLAGSKAKMVGLGMPKFTVEDFYDNFMDNLEWGRGAGGASLGKVEEMFREEGSSNYMVVFLMLLTRKHLQLEGEFYQFYHRLQLLQPGVGADVQGEQPHTHHSTDGGGGPGGAGGVPGPG